MDLQQVLSALEKADAAGDTQSAQALADLARSMMGGQQPVQPKEPTFMEGLKGAAARGLEAVPESIAGVGLGIKSALGMESAGTQAAAIREEAKKPQVPGTSWESIEQAYEKEGLLSALKKAPAFVGEKILESAPSMAVPLAAGAAAGAVSGPFAPVVAPLAGIGTYGVQQFGQFMRRQAEEGATADTLAPGKAAVASAVSAPLGYFADRFTLGLSKLPTKAIGNEIAAELAKRTSGVAGRAIKGATLGIVAEAPTEVLEQAAERWQAGLSLTDEDAKREYKEAAAGAAAIGGVGGAASRVMQGAPKVEAPVKPPAVEPEAPTYKAAPSLTGTDAATMLEEQAKGTAGTDLLAGARERRADVYQPAPSLTGADTSGMMQGAPTAGAELLSAAREQQAEQAKAQQEQQAQEQRQQVAAQEQARQMPGMFGTDTTSNQLIALQREKQQLEEAAAEKAKEIEYRKILATTYSADPLQNFRQQQAAIQRLDYTTPEVKAQEPAMTEQLLELSREDEKTAPEQKRSETFQIAPPSEVAPVTKPVVTETKVPAIETSEVDIKQPRAPSERQEAIAFGKAIGATQPYPGSLSGRVNLPAQKAAKEGNFQGVLAALEKSKNAIVAEIARRSKGLSTKIVIDDQAEETYAGESPLMRQMSIDGAKMHLEALNKIRELATEVDALPDGARLGYNITGEKINAFDKGESAGKVSLDNIANNGHSMFAPLSTGPIKLKTKEDFKALQKAFENITNEVGEDALQMTSTGSAKSIGVAGVYDSAADTIRVPEYFSKDERVLAHEIVHAQVLKKIANPSLREKPIVIRLNKLYQHVKAQLDEKAKQDKNYRKPYALESIQEFIAEGMANPSFQFELKRIKYENTSAWDSFVQTIANLIGVKRDTAFTELLSVYSELTAETKPPIETKASEAPIEGEPMPKSIDQIETEEKIKPVVESARQAIAELTKKPDNLFRFLIGKLTKSQANDISPDKKFRLLSQSAKKGKGTDLSTLVQSGSLDDFLPPNMRAGLKDPNEPFDETDAVEYIKDKLRNESTYTYDTEVALKQAFNSIEEAENLVEEFLRIEDANELLAEAAAEQRAIDKEAEIAAAKGEDRTATESVQEGLNAPTPESLKAQEERAAAEEKRIAAEKKAADEKAKADAEAGELKLTGSDRPADADADQGDFFSLEPQSPYSDLSKRNPSFKRKVDKLNRDLDSGKIELGEFANRVKWAADEADRAREATEPKPRERGADYIRQRLLEAKRRGDLSEEAVDFAEWFIQRNPQLLDDLGISIRKGSEEGVSGQYIALSRIMRLIKESGNDTTIVHEILHHMERMMPSDVQRAIRLAWLDTTSKLANQAIENKKNDPKLAEYFEKLIAGSGATDNKSSSAILKQAVKMIQDGDVDYKYYQYLNPSEFWAVNGTRIMQGRFDAVRGGALQKLKNWLKEFGQKIKSVFGLTSDAPIIKAIDSLGKADGKFVSEKMLGDVADYFSITDKAKADAELSEFTLTGSNRPADVAEAAGQKPMFSLRGKPEGQLQAFEQTLRTLLNKFGLKDIGLKLSEGMRDEGSYAAKLIQIAADSANPIRTLRHESVHALRELGFFTEAQWKSLSKMAKDKWIDQYLKQRNIDGKPLKAGEESRYDAYMREYKGDMEKITEEAVADAFADFDTKPPSGMIQAIIQRLRNLFQSIKSALTKMESAEQIFGKVEKGALKPEGEKVKGEAKSLRDRATANFRRWFGDSKVVDENGEPLVVYHGTISDFSTFDIGKSGASNRFGPGFYFTGDKRTFDTYGGKEGGNVMPVYLSMKNPQVGSALTEKQIKSFFAALQDKVFPNGYDATADQKKFEQRALDNPSKAFDTLLSAQTGYISQADWLRGMDAIGVDGIVREVFGHPEYVVFNPTQIKSATGNNGDYSLTDADIRKSLRTASPKEEALSYLSAMGRTTEKQDDSYKAKVQQSWNNAKDNPATTAKAVKDTLTNWSDEIQTKVFSSDAALNNNLRRAVDESAQTDPERVAFLLNTSLSQTVHADALANLFITEGNLKYNKDLHKWEAVKDKDNLISLVKNLEKVAAKYDLTQEQAQLIGHTAFEAKRLKSLVEFNKQVEQEVIDMRAEAAQLRKEGKGQAADALYSKANKRKTETKYIHMTDEEIANGNKLFETMPELKDLVSTWNGIRTNTVKILVDTGLWSEADAEFLLSNADYVPFFREDQLENGKGPKEFIKGLQTQAKEKKLKGSNKPVNDIFDNMVRWTQYSINRGVRNRSAVALADAAQEMGMARKVPARAGNDNVVRVWKNGEEVLYSMKDPMFIPAFTGLESIAIPSWKILSKFANILRQSVVMYPLFSISQVPQDAFAAMFTSGLKPQYALRIPVLAVKEFLKTAIPQLAGKSKAHEELRKFGAVGVRDFTADMARIDAEVLAGLKSEPGLIGKVKGMLQHIAMASDNAVRQATYEAAMSQGMSQSEALEKAFEVWNVRRKGSSQTLALAGQVIPFFNAYLAAQSVLVNTITGKGTSPQRKAEAYKNLAGTTASVMTLSLIYAMLNGDDEDYENKPAVQRDRLLMIPGSGGMSIPLRADLYTMPKVITEHTYLLLTDKGSEDGRKFRDSIKASLASALLSPTTVPQALKPLVEVGINYDFFTGRPIVGQFQKKLEVERQFNDSTSELAKVLGNTGLISPLNADQMIKGMFGSVGGLVLYATNPILHSDPDVERPTLSAREMMATLPGTSGFITREAQSGLKNDFYVLRDEVAKVASTIADMKARSPEKLEDYLSSEDVIARYGMSKAVNKMVEQLGKVRKQITLITNLPSDVMTGDEKQDQIKQLRDIEKDMLKSINVKELRAAANL